MGVHLNTNKQGLSLNQMAVASAFGDTRFPPLSKDEFNKSKIEISVLGPLKKINSISEIVPGKHGIYP